MVVTCCEAVGRSTLPLELKDEIVGRAGIITGIYVTRTYLVARDWAAIDIDNVVLLASGILIRRAARDAELSISAIASFDGAGACDVAYCNYLDIERRLWRIDNKVTLCSLTTELVISYNNSIRALTESRLATCTLNETVA